MGPSGSGKSTLDALPRRPRHVHVGPRVPRRRRPRTSSPTSKLTKLRRQTVGFVFQSFNLIPTLTALENITLPSALGGHEAEPGVVRLRRRHRRARRPAVAPAVGAVGRSAAARRRRPRAREPARRSCSPTSRPATSTPAAAPRCSASCATRSTRCGQTVVMVTHDPSAAAHADRVLFLADGRIVDALEQPTAEAVLDRDAQRLGELSPSWSRSASKACGRTSAACSGRSSRSSSASRSSSGTLVLGDTMRAGFDDLVHRGQRRAPTRVVRSATEVGSEMTTADAAYIDASLADDDRARSTVSRPPSPTVEGFGADRRQGRRPDRRQRSADARRAAGSTTRRSTRGTSPKGARPRPAARS